MKRVIREIAFLGIGIFALWYGALMLMNSMYRDLLRQDKGDLS